MNKEAAKYLLKYYYKKVNKDEVYKIINEYPNIQIQELIRIFFKDKHTYYDPNTSKPKLSDFPKPYVQVTETPRKLIIRIDSFVGIYTGTKYEKEYVKKVQDALHYNGDKKKNLVIDLRNNQGGNEKVMIKALKGVGRNGTVVVGKNTASAGEILAAILIYDHGFKRVGPQTSGALSLTKNIVLSDGSFLSVRISKTILLQVDISAQKHISDRPEISKIYF